MKYQWCCLIFHENTIAFGGFSSLESKFYHFICSPGLGTLFMIHELPREVGTGFLCFHKNKGVLE